MISLMRSIVWDLDSTLNVLPFLVPAALLVSTAISMDGMAMLGANKADAVINVKSEIECSSLASVSIGMLITSANGLIGRQATTTIS